jgi:uracil phosphoribosyltransferase
MATVLDHPLIQDKLSQARDKRTKGSDFRRLVDEISMIMAYEMTRDMPVKQDQVETPVGIAIGKRLQNQDFTIVPVLRAGLGMVNGLLEVFPDAQVAHIGLARDHDTLKPKEYYRKLTPDISSKNVIIADPMLATGGSLVAVTEILMAEEPRSIKVACLVAAPEGVVLFKERFPDIRLYVVAIDESLDERGYIIPGLGDAGDRLFNT